MRTMESIRGTDWFQSMEGDMQNKAEGMLLFWMETRNRMIRDLTSALENEDDGVEYIIEQAKSMVEVDVRQQEMFH